MSLKRICPQAQMCWGWDKSRIISDAQDEVRDVRQGPGMEAAARIALGVICEGEWVALGPCR